MLSISDALTCAHESAGTGSIADFINRTGQSLADNIYLDRDIFSALDNGRCSPDAFVSGDAALDASDCIIAKADGSVWWTPTVPPCNSRSSIARTR